MADCNLKGWDLIYKLIENDVKKKEDVLVAFIHLVLINSHYACIGLGDSKEFTGNEKSSEVLPTNWNGDPTSYALRYINEGKLYNFKALIAGDDIVVNLLNVKEVAVNSVAFNITKSVKSLKGEAIEDVIPEFNEISRKVKCELAKFSPIKEATTQTTCQEQERRGRLMESPRPGHEQPTHSGGRQPIDFQARFDPFDYGRADLDPFAAGRGGMIFDPLGSRQPPLNPGLGIPGQLPRGARPPGARFDPMGPPDIERRPRRQFPPDADHLPPPGYEDMFM